MHAADGRDVGRLRTVRTDGYGRITGRQYDAQRLGGVAVELRSHLPIERQARGIGATWLDQQLIGGTSGISDNGFGGSAALAVALIGGLFYAVLGARSDTAAIEHAFAISTVAIGAALVVAAFLISSVRQPAQAVVSEP